MLYSIASPRPLYNMVEGAHHFFITICAASASGGMGIKMKKRIPSSVKFIILAILCLIPFLSYLYNDTFIQIRYGINVVGSMVDGNGLLSFYEYNHIKAQELTDLGILHIDAAWDFPIYIILGIWNFPLYIIQEKMHVDPITNFWAASYGKSLFLLFLAFSTVNIYKICKYINIEDILIKYAVIIYLTSCMTFSSVYIMGQSDVIVIAFVLLGTLDLMKKNYWKFIVWFAMAISMKPFALIVFIPLLLLVEKNLIKILLKLMLACSIMGFSKLVFAFWGGTGIAEKSIYEKKELTIMLSNKLPFFNGSVPVIVFLFAILCLYCYFKCLDDSKRIESYVWISLIAASILVVSFQAPPYRFLYLAPYFAILIALHTEHFKTNVFLETVGAISLLFSHFIVYYWCYDVDKMQEMLLWKLFGGVSAESKLTLKNIADVLSPFNFVGYAFFGVTLLFFCWNNRPECPSNDSENCNFKKIMIYRLAFNTVACYAPIALYFLNLIIS